MAFNPQARPVARCLTWRDPEPGRGQDALRISDLSVTPVPLNHAVFAWLRGGVWAGQDSNTPANSDSFPAIQSRSHDCQQFCWNERERGGKWPLDGAGR
jgi:hypothetical protein